MLESLARTLYRRRRRVVAAWAVALVAVAALAGAWPGDHQADYGIPGSESARAQELLRDRFPERSGDAVQLVFATDGVAVTEAAVAGRIAEISAAAGAIPHVVAAAAPVPSPDGRVALVSLQLDQTMEQVPVESIREVMDLAAASSTEGLVVEAGGPAVQNAEGTEAGSEQIGMLAALVILLVAFGSVLAAGLPILVALFGIGVALGLVELLQHLLVVPEWAPSLVTMIAIGVGIDYALFVVTRYRSALADGLDPEDAVVTAVTTAGRAVLFAGGTVVISLLGLTAMGLDYLYGTAAAMVLGVLVVLLASMTLLPAMLGFCGRSIDRLRLPFVRGDRGDDGLWARWSRVVQRRPLVTAAVALVVLVALAAPFGSLRFGYPDAGTGPSSLTSRRAYDTVTAAFGPGANGQLVVAVETGAVAVDDVVATLEADPGVAVVLPPQRNAAGDTAALVVQPTTGPQDEASEELIRRLRDALPDGVHVGGSTAAFLDESAYMGDRLPVFVGAVLVLSFLLLLAVFRSLLVALKAAVMNLLAIGAAYGVMAVALDGGWLGELVGIHESTPVPAWAPMMMFAVLFGLSMDYEVFLLSRIREEYLRTGDNAAAVAHGIARTGRVISAAAAIMVTVFGAFLLGDQVLVKAIGLGLATAVLLDATVVRMVLVPSTMELLGDRNWWVPRWLDRVLPRIDVEGADGPAAEDVPSTRELVDA